MNKKWEKVGSFLKDNAASGLALVGSLMTGNAPAAIAMGASMVAKATGTDDPDQALAALQGDPQTIARLKEIANERDAEINRHIEAQELMRLEDQQSSHQETQKTVRAGDATEDKVVRYTRPGQSWVSLLAAITYAFTAAEPDPYLLGLFLTLPFTYAGLREAGKWKVTDTLSKIGKI